MLRTPLFCKKHPPSPRKHGYRKQYPAVGGVQNRTNKTNTTNGTNG